MSSCKLRKNKGKILGNRGKVREFGGIKKWEPCVGFTSSEYSMEKIVGRSSQLLLVILWLCTVCYSRIVWTLKYINSERLLLIFSAVKIDLILIFKRVLTFSQDYEVWHFKSQNIVFSRNEHVAACVVFCLDANMMMGFACRWRKPQVFLKNSLAKPNKAEVKRKHGKLCLN